MAPVLRLKMIPNMLNTNSTHTGIASPYLTTPHTCYYMGYGRQVGHAARSSKNQGDYTKFLELLIHEKWNNCLHPYLTLGAEQRNY